MLDLKSEVSVSINGVTHLVLFDTGVTKNLFRRNDLDYIKLFNEAYQRKFGDFKFNYLITPLTFIELLGCKNELPKSIENYSKLVFCSPRSDDLLKCAFKIESLLRKNLSKSKLIKKYHGELEYPLNQKGTKVFLKNGYNTYLNNKKNINSFYFMLGVSFLLQNNKLREIIQKEIVKTKSFFYDLLNSISKKMPNQSVVHLIYSLAQNVQEKDNVILKKFINFDYISVGLLRKW